jgi:NADH dehydrogenase
MSLEQPAILILGGSGFVGRSLCEQLVQHFGGCARLTLPSRRPDKAKALRALPGLTLLGADVHDDAQLARLLQGQDVVVNLIAILQGSEAAFERAHVQLPQRLTRLCPAHTRLVHVSALGVSEQAPSRYLRSKARGEAVLRAARPEATVLRPSVIFGADDSFLNLFARLQGLFPLMPLAGAEARFQPVWVEDVARALLRCIVDAPATTGRVFEAAGPREWRLAELVRLAGRLSGHQRPILPLPGPLARLQALAMECLPGEPLMSRDNLDSMRVPNVASGQLPGLAELGITPADLETVAPGYLGRDRRERLDEWRARRF